MRHVDDEQSRESETEQSTELLKSLSCKSYCNVKRTYIQERASCIKILRSSLHIHNARARIIEYSGSIAFAINEFKCIQRARLTLDMATLKYATVPISQSAAKYCRRWSPTVTLILQKTDRRDLGGSFAPSRQLHFHIFVSRFFFCTAKVARARNSRARPGYLFSRPPLPSSHRERSRSRSLRYILRSSIDRQVEISPPRNSSSLRTASPRTEAERAENYVECVRSVAGGVYFVMQINARLPNHPLPSPLRLPDRRDSFALFSQHIHRCVVYVYVDLCAKRGELRCGSYTL